MIRTARIPITALSSWLQSQAVAPGGHQYRLRLWKEDAASFSAVADHLKTYFEEAFEDARRTLRKGFDDDLSPFDTRLPDPAANFPALLHQVTLQGYVGETLAAIATEHWGAHGIQDWHIPAFLFRFHVAEFQHLEAINELLAEGGVPPGHVDAEQRPGRTGDDCLAFRMDGTEKITAVLTIESKCLGQHHSKKLEQAHEKLSAGTRRPPGIRELVNLLSEYDENPEAIRWRVALRKLWFGGFRAADRFDGLTYVCSASPKRKRVSWLDDANPHAAYKGGRPLEAMEFHIDVDAFVDRILRRK